MIPVPLFFDFFIIGLMLLGIWLFRRPMQAKYGNLVAAAALALAAVLVIYRHGIMHPYTLAVCIAAGGIPGFWVARKITMIHIPAMVAFQNGAGGIAAFFLSFAELMRGARHLGAMNEISGLLGIAIGAVTFSGSMVAAGKLSGLIRQTPVIFPRHTRWVMVNLGAMVLLILAAFAAPAGGAVVFYLLIFGLAIVFGIVFSVRVGGADMPVLISFLNATTGVAAALCGMVFGNQLLIACGATVAASGSILTHVMCRAMNRSLYHVFVPEKPAVPRAADPELVVPAAPPAPEPVRKEPDPAQDLFATAADRIRKARTIIIVPGYGMAVAQAQFGVIELTGLLTAAGKQVTFAIHPVAGRMPGHMNVLLAEAGVDYEMLAEMDEINPAFAGTDLCLVIGACDVVNPAAMETEGTPISGMPILKAHEAKTVVVCNLDDAPGYSGVENPLYASPNTLMLPGNARQTLRQIMDALAKDLSEKTGDPLDPGRLKAALIPPEKSGLDTAVSRLLAAEKIIVVPGYGMALAQAQFQVKELADLLASMGKQVSFAIHPVAGRMPGHMNVLLAEAEVDYDKLMEMDAINPEFSQTDVVLVFGACDVVNPAAMETEGTPISGMPILKAHEAKTVVVCNLDDTPGYSGVANTLYTNPNTILLTGDAAATARSLIAGVKTAT
jgi:H+-translocating NAD(P) transhydrogenase subunit beta